MDNYSKSKSFEDVVAWQKAHAFVLAIYKVTKTFPKDEVFGLTSQFKRAAVSIAANIAEGYKKTGEKDKLRFLNIGQGSLEECRYYLLLAKDIEFITIEKYEELKDLINSSSYMLNSYAKAIRETIK